MKEIARPCPFDFYVRMHEVEFERLPLRQMDAQLDWGLSAEETPPVGTGACASCICGYTEWVTDSTPPVSVGWDWVATSAGVLTLIPESIRTNLMLVNELGGDCGHSVTAHAISRVISRRPWQRSVLDAL